MFSKSIGIMAIAVAGFLSASLPAGATETIEGTAFINAASPPAAIEVAVGAKVCVTENPAEVGPYVGVSIDPIEGGPLKWSARTGSDTPPEGYHPVVCFDAVKPGKMNIMIGVNVKQDGQLHHQSMDEVQITVK